MRDKYVFYNIDMNEKLGEIESQDVAIAFLQLMFNDMGIDNLQIQRVIIEEEEENV